MEKTVNTAWYAKKCALGALVCCGAELVLLMLASALMLRGTISEGMADGAVLVCAAVAAFLGCVIGAGKTSKRAMMTAGCVASAWVMMQVIGFLVCDGLAPERRESVQQFAQMEQKWRGNMPFSDAGGEAASALQMWGRGAKSTLYLGKMPPLPHFVSMVNIIYFT